jgi:hypothetical protein
MPRGERATPGRRGPSLAIGAVFGAICLVALWFVLQTQHGCERSAAPGPASEPFAGAHAALGALGTRGCPRVAGPAIPGGVAPLPDIEAWARAHGYVAAESWRPPTPLPGRFDPASLDGACGVIAVAVDGSGTISDYGRASDATARTPCSPQHVLVATCGDDAVEVRGVGDARARTFALPGITPEVVARVGIELPLLLAHAEAESVLRGFGWTPTDEIVVDRSRAATAYGATLTPPPSPASGCVVWVAAGAGLGQARTTWMGHTIAHDLSSDELLAGVATCAPPATSTELYADGGPGVVAWRAWAPRAGPSVPSPPGTEPLSIAAIRVVSAADAVVPTGVEAISTTP